MTDLVVLVISSDKNRKFLWFCFQPDQVFVTFPVTLGFRFFQFRAFVKTVF